VKYLVFGVWWSASCLSNVLQKDDWDRSSTKLPAFPHIGLVEFGIAFSLPLSPHYCMLLTIGIPIRIQRISAVEKFSVHRQF